MESDNYYRTSWWDRNREMVMVLGGFVSAFIGIISGGITMQVFAERRGCEAVGRKMDVQAEYSMWTGCMVKIDGKWLPLDNVRKVVK